MNGSALNSILVELGRQAQREAGIYGNAIGGCAPTLQSDAFMHGKSRWSRFWGPRQWWEWNRANEAERKEMFARAIWQTVAEAHAAKAAQEADEEKRLAEVIANRRAIANHRRAMVRFDKQIAARQHAHRSVADLRRAKQEAIWAWESSEYGSYGTR